MKYRLWNNYKVYEDGSIESPKGRLLKPTVSPKGYLLIRVKFPDGKWKSGFHHKIVAEAWHGPRPEGYEIDHIDNNRSNNSKDNLRYVTKHENRVKSYRQGYRDVKGSKNANSKHTEEQIKWVCIELSKNVPAAVIARSYGISYNTVLAVKNRRQWKHVSDKYFA